jgi:uncharacterized protein YidB (DUF937 family)
VTTTTGATAMRYATHDLATRDTHAPTKASEARRYRGRHSVFGRGDGTSPITMRVLGLLAHKAIQGMNKGGRGVGDGIGDWLRKAFGDDGSAGDRQAGGVLGGGLRDLVGQFQQSGEGDVAKSWVGPGANLRITPHVLAKVLSEEQIATLMAHTGLSRAELLQGMSKELPQAVDSLTPDGRLPAPDEIDRLLERKTA